MIQIYGRCANFSTRIFISSRKKLATDLAAKAAEDDRSLLTDATD